MKIRQGFVSNSSSSSFILMGQRVRFSDLTLNDIPYTMAVGKYLCDGQDVFVLTDEILLELKNNNYPMEEFSFFRIIREMVDSEEITFDAGDLPNGEITVLSLDQDQHSTNNVEELRSSYLNESEEEHEF